MDNKENEKEKVEPTTTIVAGDAGTSIEVELPGVAKKDIRIEEEDGTITLEGTTPSDENDYELEIETDSKLDSSDISKEIEDESAKVVVPAASLNDPGSISISGE